MKLGITPWIAPSCLLESLKRAARSAIVEASGISLCCSAKACHQKLERLQRHPAPFPCAVLQLEFEIPDTYQTGHKSIFGLREVVALSSRAFPASKAAIRSAISIIGKEIFTTRS